MESKRNTVVDNYKEEEEESEVENNETLKRRISSHPLYELLVEAHLDCLKVGDISKLDRELKKEQKQAIMKKQNSGMFNHSELDLFMEAYCLALNKLKEAIEEPQMKSMAFINNMHSQLRELTDATMPAAPAEEAAIASSSECTFRKSPTI
ncbi:homeobox protein knotted-1-like 6 [Lotus japonicus]|uniref:Fused compound leaf 1 n=1 Tax=Lotus japonicus TaxID=34305 RepID=G9BXE7_LOTJA|nr:homeobox protein knotted-1-like 6 [Lotus japonicus]AET87101.1 fused compound leaf 1 [Lotus japonicus]